LLSHWLDPLLSYFFLSYHDSSDCVIGLIALYSQRLWQWDWWPQTGSNELWPPLRNMWQELVPPIRIVQANQNRDQLQRKSLPSSLQLISFCNRKNSAFLPILTSDATCLVGFSLSLFYCQAEEEGRHTLSIIFIITLFTFIAIIRAITCRLLRLPLLEWSLQLHSKASETSWSSSSLSLLLTPLPGLSSFFTHLFSANCIYFYLLVAFLLHLSLQSSLFNNFVGGFFRGTGGLKMRDWPSGGGFWHAFFHPAPTLAPPCIDFMFTHSLLFVVLFFFMVSEARLIIFQNFLAHVTRYSMSYWDKRLFWFSICRP